MDVAGTGVALHLAIGIPGLSRSRFAISLRLLRSGPPLHHLRFKISLRSLVAGLHLCPSIVQRLEFFIRFECVALHPRLCGTPAPRIVDKAHRHAECLLKLAAKEIADCRKVCHCFRRADSPLAVKVGLWLLRPDLWNREETDRGQLCRCLFKVGIVCAVDAPLHVGLASTHPHLADEHIVKRNCVLPFHRERMWSAVFSHRIQKHTPHSVCASGGRMHL